VFANPLKILNSIGIHEDSIVADLGAGTGHYTIIVGSLVPKGKVYAVELQKDFLSTIKGKINDLHLSNIEVIWGNVEKVGGTMISDNVVDVAIASNVLFQVEEKDHFASEVYRILKPKGRVLLIDWSDGSIVHGSKIITQDQARTLFEKKGFIFERLLDAGNHHYGMILIKQ
jgi:ubiquinone/menaquinone biosynthesis C-methylase UbiE